MVEKGQEEDEGHIVAMTTFTEFQTPLESSNIWKSNMLSRV